MLFKIIETQSGIVCHILSHIILTQKVVLAWKCDENIYNKNMVYFGLFRRIFGFYVQRR